MTRLQIDIPVLTTERLTLRAFEERDLPVYSQIVADPEVMRFIGDGRPLNEIEAWRQIAQILGHWALRGFGLWAVEDRSTKQLIGRIGLLEPGGWPGFEIAYTIARAAWGRGYAREGARAALEYAQDVLHRTEIISIIRPENTASIRVATSLGARRTRAVEFFGSTSDIYQYPSRRTDATSGD